MLVSNIESDVTFENLKNNFLMLHRSTLEVRMFQLPTPERLSTVVKNILGGLMAPMSNRVKL